MIDKAILLELYRCKKKSMQEIADILQCSLHKVAYWIDKHQIQVRSRSEATYIKRNPKGDPFLTRLPQNTKEGILYGMGVGLYWGEGTKANTTSIRLGNTDPKLLQKFIEFLIVFGGIKKTDLKFALQIFSDISPKEALDFWAKELKINKSQFNKPVVTKSGSIGTYRKKSQYGVLTVMFHNKKLRDWLVNQLPE